MKNKGRALGLMLCLLLSGPARAQSDRHGHLLEVRPAAAAPVQAHAAAAPAELKIVSYNIRWRGGEELKELVEILRSDSEVGGAAIVGLQEVDRAKKRTKNEHTGRLIAESLGMHMAWAAPPPARDGEEEETGVALLSPFPMTDVERIVLPHEGPNKRRRVAVGATVHVGEVQVRAYSVHAETRMPLKKKVEHWAAVLEDLKKYPHVTRAVVVGDFNTIKGKDVRAARRLFTDAGFTTPFPDDRSTWKTFIVKLKLDWLWLRGFEAGDFGIDKKVGFSDHYPLWAKVRVGPKDGAPPAEPSSAGRR